MSTLLSVAYLKFCSNTIFYFFVWISLNCEFSYSTLIITRLLLSCNLPLLINIDYGLYLLYFILVLTVSNSFLTTYLSFLEFRCLQQTLSFLEISDFQSELTFSFLFQSKCFYLFYFHLSFLSF